MMKPILFAASLAAVCAASAFQDGERINDSNRISEPIELYKNDVIPVKFQQDICFSKNERGDRFSAVVDGDRTLPKGTVFEGRIVELRQGRGKQPGSMVLEFNRIVMPDGDSVRVIATPIAWKEKSMKRTRDGRWEAKGTMKREDWVIGGLAGGLLVGSMARKPFEGAFIGTLAGIILAESDKSFSNDLVIRRGDKVGALIERDVKLALDADREESNRIRVTCEGRELRFDRDLLPYESNGVVMVPLEAAAKELEVSIDEQEDRDFILMTGNDHSVRLNRNESDYRINGKRRELPRNPETRNGVLYVPLEVFENLVNGTLRTDGTKLEQKE